MPALLCILIKLPASRIRLARERLHRLDHLWQRDMCFVPNVRLRQLRDRVQIERGKLADELIALVGLELIPEPQDARLPSLVEFLADGLFVHGFSPAGSRPNAKRNAANLAMRRERILARRLACARLRS